MKLDYYVQVATGAIPCEVAGERLVSGRVYVLMLDERELGLVRARMGHQVTIRRNSPDTPRLAEAAPVNNVEPAVSSGMKKADVAEVAKRLGVYDAGATKAELIDAIRVLHE